MATEPDRAILLARADNLLARADHLIVRTRSATAIQAIIVVALAARELRNSLAVTPSTDGRALLDLERQLTAQADKLEALVERRPRRDRK